MKRSGSAVWQGGLKDGKGTLSTESGTLEGCDVRLVVDEGRVREVVRVTVTRRAS